VCVRERESERVYVCMCVRACVRVPVLECEEEVLWVHLSKRGAQFCFCLCQRETQRGRWVREGEPGWGKERQGEGGKDTVREVVEW